MNVNYENHDIKSDILADIRQYSKLHIERENVLKDMIDDIYKMQGETNRLLAIIINALVDTDYISREELKND